MDGKDQNKLKTIRRMSSDIHAGSAISLAGHQPTWVERVTQQLSYFQISYKSTDFCSSVLQHDLVTDLLSWRGLLSSSNHCDQITARSLTTPMPEVGLMPSHCRNRLKLTYCKTEYLLYSARGINYFAVNISWRGTKKRTQVKILAVKSSLQQTLGM